MADTGPLIVAVTFAPQQSTKVRVEHNATVKDLIDTVKGKRNAANVLPADLVHHLGILTFSGLQLLETTSPVHLATMLLEEAGDDAIFRIVADEDVGADFSSELDEHGAPQQEALRPSWQKDAEASDCTLCRTKFTFTRRRHHCRNCGMVVCKSCCELRRLPEMGYTKPVLMCKDCFQYQVIGPSKRMSTYAGVRTSRKMSLAPGDTGVDQLVSLRKILLGDPLGDVSPREKDLVWSNWHTLTGEPAALCWILRSVAWETNSDIARILEKCAPPASGTQALELLAGRFPSKEVHLYAVRHLNLLTDEEVVNFVPQLIQALKVESVEDMEEANSLASFVLQKASKMQELCHFLYWSIMAEMHRSEVRPQFEYLRKRFFRECTTEEQRLDFLQQHALLRHLAAAQRIIKSEKEHVNKTALLQAQLAGIHFACPCRLPANPNVFVDGFVESECRVMSSNAQPLFIVLSVANFETKEDGEKKRAGMFATVSERVASLRSILETSSHDTICDHVRAIVDMTNNLLKELGIEEDELLTTSLSELARASQTLDRPGLERTLVYLEAVLSSVVGNKVCKRVAVIYKEGDDLRQDLLAMQVIHTLNVIWKDNLDDLFGTTYGCVATGDSVGLIEVIPKATTVAAIHRQHGVRGCFREDGLSAWIEAQPLELSEKPGDKKEKFMKSCVAYCVATYLLGVGDRHNDNIMVARDGRLFHIDFGLILGHWQKFCGISRDRVPFVLTADIVHVFKGEDDAGLKEFERLCCQCYLRARVHGRTLLSLFTLMTSSGIPTLSSTRDIDHLRDSLILRCSKGEAISNFKGLIEKSLSSQAAQLNFFVHNVAALAKN